MGVVVAMTELDNLLQRLNTVWNTACAQKHSTVWLHMLGEIWGWGLLWGP